MSVVSVLAGWQLEIVREWGGYRLVHAWKLLIGGLAQLTVKIR